MKRRFRAVKVEEVECEPTLIEKSLTHSRGSNFSLVERDGARSLVVVHLLDSAQEDLADFEALLSGLLLGVAECDERLKGRETERESVTTVGFDVVNDAGESLHQGDGTSVQ